jgi:hypothetical protein
MLLQIRNAARGALAFLRAAVTKSPVSLSAFVGQPDVQAKDFANDRAEGLFDTVSHLMSPIDSPGILAQAGIAVF